MYCHECGAYAAGPYCPVCGAKVEAPAASPSPSAKSSRGNSSVALAAAATVVVLIFLAAGTWFGVSYFLNKGSDSTSPQPPQMQSAPGASGQAAPNESSTSSESPSASSSSSTTDAEQAAVAELNQWASDDRSKITVSDDSWAARLATKWVGITSEAEGHPQPYTATEILQEFKGYQSQYGDHFKVVKSGDVGVQVAGIKGKDGWLAIVTDDSIYSKDSAQAWCTSHYNDINKCGYQHLDTAHDPQ